MATGANGRLVPFCHCSVCFQHSTNLCAEMRPSLERTISVQMKLPVGQYVVSDQASKSFLSCRSWSSAS
jgi:hypothetical protein